MLKISVIIPVYNAENFLQKAVYSALQFEEVKEILLIEDKSTDSSLEICKNLAAENSKIKLFQHSDKGNHGAGASRNLGLEMASQEFIAFLDADDYYLSNRFEAEKDLFKEDKVEGVFGALGVEFLSEKGKEEFQDKFKNNVLTTVNYPAEGENVFSGLMGINKEFFGYFFHLNTLTVRKSSIKKNNVVFNINLRTHQDSDFIIKLSYYCYLKTGIITEAVAIRGIHDDNRITKIKNYSSVFYKNKLALHRSLYDWGKKTKLKKTYQHIFEMQYLTYKVANKKGLKKYASFFLVLFLHPEFIRTRYRYHALSKHYDD